jgi:hypothetical protein
LAIDQPTWRNSALTAASCAIFAIFGHDIGRERDDRQTLGAAAQFPFANAPRRCEPIHHRHLVIHQDRVEGGGGDSLQGFGAVVGNGHVRRQVLQRSLRHAPLDGIVLHQQDFAAPECGQRLGGVISESARAAFCRSLADLAAHADFAAHQFGQPVSVTSMVNEERLLACRRAAR